MPVLVLLRGGGDLASGVAFRLHRCGLRIVIAEVQQPLAVRRKVSFAEAVYQGSIEIEGISASLVSDMARIEPVLDRGQIAVIVDPGLSGLPFLKPDVLIDGRMLKKAPETSLETAPVVIGLGPGFTAGKDCHAVIETMRGHFLGKVIWDGQAEPDTGVPDAVRDIRVERVLRAPASGSLRGVVEIGDHLEPGQTVAEVNHSPIIAPFRGVLRGLVHPGVYVQEGLKVGDVDPRDDPRYCFLISDKSLAIGGGVLEAIFSRPELRQQLSR